MSNSPLTTLATSSQTHLFPTGAEGENESAGVGIGGAGGSRSRAGSRAGDKMHDEMGAGSASGATGTRADAPLESISVAWCTERGGVFVWSNSTGVVELEAEVEEVKVEPPPADDEEGEGEGEGEGGGERTTTGESGESGEGAREEGDGSGSGPEGGAMNPMTETRSLVFGKFSRSSTMAVDSEWSGANQPKKKTWTPNLEGLVPLRASNGVLRCGVAFSEGDRWLLAWGRRSVQVWRRSAVKESNQSVDGEEKGEDLDSIFRLVVGEFTARLPSASSCFLLLLVSPARL